MIKKEVSNSRYYILHVKVNSRYHIFQKTHFIFPSLAPPSEIIYDRNDV